MAEVTSKSTSYGRRLHGYYRTVSRDSTILSQNLGSASGTNTTVGEKNPKWREQVKNHVQAATPFTGWRVGVRSRPYYYLREHSNPLSLPSNVVHTVELWGHLTRTFPSVSAVNALSESEANNKALMIHVSKIRAAQTTFQGSVAVGEFAATWRMMRRPLQTLRTGIDRFVTDVKKRRRKLKALKHLARREVVSSLWLEYAFGWRPLISDINSAAEALAEANIIVNPPFKIIRSVGKSETASNGSSISSQPVGDIEYREDNINTVEVRYLSEINLETRQVSQRRLGLSTADFALTAWELVPWSFLIDYFVNVDNVISAWSLPRSDVRWTVKTVHRSVKKTARFTRVINNNPTVLPTITVEPGSSVCYRRKVQRDPYVGSFVPSLEFSIPGMGTKWLNIAALFAGRKLTNGILAYKSAHAGRHDYTE